MGVHVNVDNRSIIFFRNGAPVCRATAVNFPDGVLAAVTLANVGNWAQLVFRHPSEDEEAPSDL